MTSRVGLAGTIPLIVGVTGHRDLHAEHVPVLAAALAAEFARLREQYPHSSLVLLSPLAEGADRVAARVALEQGVRLIVPLPLPLDLYQDDFESADSRAEFGRLLEQAEARIALPLLPGATLDAVRKPGI